MSPVSAALALMAGALMGEGAFLVVGKVRRGEVRSVAAKAMRRLTRAGPLLAAWLPKGRGRGVRANDCSRQLPVFLDIVTLGLAAGLSFDASLELYCDRCDTELSALVACALQSWRVGARSRTEGLEWLADEVGSASMQRFAATVAEALAFGTPLSGALSRQAQSMRDEQRAQMEEAIEKVPVKLLIPLGTLIVPAMLISILGPLLAPALTVL